MPVTRKTANAKRKKLAVPSELLEIINEADNDSDTVTADLNERDISFIAEISSESGDESASNAKATKAISKTKSKSTKSNAATESQTEQSNANVIPPISNEKATNANNGNAAPTNVTTGAEAVRIEDLGPETENSVGRSTATGESTRITATGDSTRSTATGVAASTSKGAIPKSKAAMKQYEFPKERSWADEVERGQRSVQQTQHTDGASGGALESIRPPLVEPTTSTRTDRFVSHRSQASKRPINYDEPPGLMVDPQMRALYGNSAYFEGGEYRKPDQRTVYIEGMERMYQNTMQATFGLLPKETIEYHIKAAEKYWDKFLEAHNQLYSSCGTLEEMESHRVVHRNTQRLNENLMTKLLQQLSIINAEAREAERRSTPLSQQSNRDDRNNRDRHNIMSEVKFEKIRIEPFNGHYQKWPQFKRIFETYFHNTDSSNSAKMVHLISHLAENSEPRNLISGLDPRGENYEIAWKTICDAYDDERRILDSMITSFLDIPKVQTPTRAALMNLVTRTKNLIEPMPTYGINTDTWGVWIVPIIVRKLDTASRSEWCMERPRRVRPSVQPLLQFISDRAEGVDELPQTHTAHQNNQNSGNNRFGNKKNSANSSGAASGEQPNRMVKKNRCPDPLCAPNNEHQLYGCPRFKSLDIEHRRHKVRALSVCELCLRKGHAASTCTMKPCQECDERHNSWLCTRKIRVASAVTTAPLTTHAAAFRSAADTRNTEAMFSTANKSMHAPLLATAAITVTDRKGQIHELRALLDQGSQADMITAAAYHVVGHGKTHNRLTVSGIGGKETTSVGQADISFQSQFSPDRHFHITALVLPTITSRLPATHLNTASWKHLVGLPLADPNFNIPGDIDVVLGASTCAELIKPDIVKGVSDQPIAQCTEIGWVVYGSTQAPSRYIQTLSAVAELTDEPRIDELLTKLWQIEDVPTTKVRSLEEKLCEEMFVAHTERDETGRYIVRIPIKANAPKLGDSRGIAVRRLLQMEARFARKPELKQQYVEFMTEYLRLGHMVAARPLPQDGEHNYIPHHAAGTKKFRVVFDGSSKTSNGIAFNDIQMIGEKLQPDLTSITMRFRTHRIAITADIKKMYRQVLVCHDQRDYQRIVWRENVTKPIKDYQLVTQTYGLRSAPHNCVRALVQCANDNELEHPLAAEITRRDFYIDDMLSGADTVDDAGRLCDDMNAMLGKGCFELAKWNTNSNELRSRLQFFGSGQTLTIDKEEDDSSVLGLRWNPTCDVFKYSISLPKQNEKITKRRIVSNVAKLYDPNGYVSPVVITAKVLIQKLWRSDCTWDSKVPTELAKEYNDFVTELPQLERLSIPRWIGTESQSPRDLHAFCDASSIAYGCAFYIKTTDPASDTIVRLVASKTRVAPLKRMTIPRLELCGAHLLAKMLNTMCHVHDISPKNCHLWSDSMIVLSWLQKTPTTTGIYVANRVAETSELTKSCTWRHVPTKDNPADMVSRGVSASTIVDEKLWWEGPAWVAQPEGEWPKREIMLSNEQKIAIAAESSPPRPVAIHVRHLEPFLENEKGDILQQFSQLHRLVRITAWVVRFCRNANTKSNSSTGPITAEEYLTAELLWIKHEQKQYFAKEIGCSGEQSEIPKKSRLLGLKPFMENGVLRGKGRLENSTLPYDSTHPMIMSAESRFTRLIVQSAHRATLHGGTQLTMHYVRQKFWVPSLRRLTRQVIHKCDKCRRHNAITMQQQMGALPRVRITPGRAFQKCGVDYCGPFYIKARGGRCKIIMKAYVAVFVCMASRGVHLELVSDMTSNAFLAALSKLSSRRGRVHELYSDNGTTFRGADKDIANAVNSWKQLRSDSMFQALYIKWSFIPPVAPHQGGLWEAAVKSAKHHLRRVVGDQQLTFEEFYTILTQVEACLNSRPISRTTDDNTDNLALTPSHFWALEPVVAPMAQDHTEVPQNRLQRWQLLHRFVQDFWRRWKDEYLDQLFRRTKWQSEDRNAAIDDVVLVRSENTPPTQWPMGRIVNVFPGKDGLVRSVDVTYGGHVYRRPITKLILLPTTELE